MHYYYACCPPWSMYVSNNKKIHCWTITTCILGARCNVQVLPKREEKKNEHGCRIQHVSRIYVTSIWINLMLMLFSKCRSEMFSTVCDFKASSLLILLLFSAVHGRPDLFGSSSRQPNLISADCWRPDLIRTRIDLSRPWTTRFDLVLLKWLYWSTSWRDCIELQHVILRSIFLSLRSLPACQDCFLYAIPWFPTRSQRVLNFRIWY